MTTPVEPVHEMDVEENSGSESDNADASRHEADLPARVGKVVRRAATAGEADNDRTSNPRQSNERANKPANRNNITIDTSNKDDEIEELQPKKDRAPAASVEEDDETASDATEPKKIQNKKKKVTKKPQSIPVTENGEDAASDDPDPKNTQQKSKKAPKQQKRAVSMDMHDSFSEEVSIRR